MRVQVVKTMQKVTGKHLSVLRCGVCLESCGCGHGHKNATAADKCRGLAEVISCPCQPVTNKHQCPEVDSR